MTLAWATAGQDGEHNETLRLVGRAIRFLQSRFPTLMILCNSLSISLIARSEAI